MKDFKLYTKFNFAECVHLSLLSIPEGNLCSSPEGNIRFIEGIIEFTKPYLQELQENTIIPDYLTLVSIQTIENEVNQITNKLITNLINYLPDYPWYEYIYNSNDQFDENLPELINAGNHLLSIYINTDDCSMEFSTEQPDAQSELVEDYSFTIACITFLVYFD